MKKKISRVLIISLLVLVIAVPVMAQEPVEDALPACIGNISGVVVEVNEEGGFIVLDVSEDTEPDLCTLGLDDNNYDHPIVTLLDAYFGYDSETYLETYMDLLGATTVCAVYDEVAETWGLDDPVEEVCADGIKITITGVDGEGNFIAEDQDGEPFVFFVDDVDVVTALTEILDALIIEVVVDEDGVIEDVGDDIIGYHDDGIGFGELVKIYAIAGEADEACQAASAVPPAEGGDVTAAEGDFVDPCEITVEFLVAAFNGGMSMGEMFAEYGKPSLLGVGHVRKALGAGGSASDGTNTDGDGLNGICNARAHGGNAYANGQVVDCGDPLSP
jgi:hypothetical protein